MHLRIQQGIWVSIQTAMVHVKNSDDDENQRQFDKKVTEYEIQASVCCFETVYILLPLYPMLRHLFKVNFNSVFPRNVKQFTVH